MNPTAPIKKIATNWLSTLFGERLFFISLLLLVVGLPLSSFLVSFSQMLLVINWGIEGNFRQKFDLLRKRKVYIFLLLPLVHLLWLLNTTDFSYALHDLKIKLPLLVLPVVLGSREKFSFRKHKIVLLLFSAAVIVSTFISYSVFTGLIPHEVNDIRDISIIISHIRLGLMIVFSILILLYFFRNAINTDTLLIRLIYAGAIVWLIYFLFVLQSITSWVIFFVLPFFIFYFYYRKLGTKTARMLGWVFIISVTLFLAGLIGQVLFQFYTVDKINKKELPIYTENGNPYFHNINSTATENGHYVWLYISWKELHDMWPTLSNMPFNGLDAKGQPLRFTAIRYLTSKNLTKDSIGLKSLDKKDIEMIENGQASCIYRKKFTPYIKVYELVWELDRYIRTGNPNGKTLSMRIEFLKAGFHIIHEHKWVGVGTGDIKTAFEDYYSKSDTKLGLKYRLRTHNQFVTLLITFGIVGFSLCLIGLFFPIWYHKSDLYSLAILFLIIAFFSFLDEDTLETQAGVTFFVFYYSFFLFLKKTKPE